jgi:hypothetical protein
LIAIAQPTTIQSSLGKKETIRLKLLITNYHITYGNNWRRQLARGVKIQQQMKQLFLSQEAENPMAMDLIPSPRLWEALRSAPAR